MIYINTTTTTYVLTSRARGETHNWPRVIEAPPSSPHAVLSDNVIRCEMHIVRQKHDVPSVDDLTTTNLSKLSSTSFRMSCERESNETFRWAIPAASS